MEYQIPVVYNNAEAVPRAVNDTEHLVQQQEEHINIDIAEEKCNQENESCKKCPFSKCGKVGKRLWKAFLGFNFFLILAQIFVFPASMFFAAIPVGILGLALTMRVYRKYGLPMLDQKQAKLAKTSIVGIWVFLTGFFISLTFRQPVFMVPGVIVCGVVVMKLMKQSSTYNTKFHKHAVIFLLVSITIIFVTSFNFNCSPRHTHSSFYAAPLNPRRIRHHEYPHRPENPPHNPEPEQPEQPQPEPEQPEFPSNDNYHRSEYYEEENYASSCLLLHFGAGFITLTARFAVVIWAIALLIHFIVHKVNQKKQAILPVNVEEQKPTEFSYPTRVPVQPTVVPVPQHYAYPAVPQQYAVPTHLPQYVLPPQTHQPTNYPYSYLVQQQHQQQTNQKM